MSIYSENNDLTFKYYNKNYEYNDLSIFIDSNEIFLPILEKSSTEEDNDDIYFYCRIPDNPLESQEEEDINYNINLSISEKDNNNINLEKSDKSKLLQEKENINSNEKMNEKEIKFLLSNKRKNINEKTNKIKSKNETITKNTKTTNENNKYNFSNILRTLKHCILNSIVNFINNEIVLLYNNKIGNGIFKKQLQTLNQKDKSESNIKFNQEFLNRTLKDIFSNDVSGRFTNIPKDHNKKIIENLLNENDLFIRNHFTNLFNLTFKQCLEHYRGTKFYNELNGMKKFEEDSSSIVDDKEYLKILDYYIQNYETIINNKKPRKSKNKEEN